MPLLTATSEHMRNMIYHIARVHERRTRKSTKIANNTYGRVENDTGEYADVIYKYHDTDIIRALYEYGVFLDNDGNEYGALNILAVEIFTDGWEDSLWTVRRIEAFFRNNLLPYVAFTFERDFYVMHRDILHEWQNQNHARLYRETGLTKKERLDAENMFNKDTHTAFIPISMPVIHKDDTDTDDQ